MATIRQRIARVLFQDEFNKVGNALEMLAEGYRVGPGILSPEVIAQNIQEMDSQLLDMILRQRGWTVIGGLPGMAGTFELSEADRLRAVDESRRMAHYDVQTRRGIESWTDFGFGQSIMVQPKDPKQKEVWDEFYEARRNIPIFKKRRVQKLSTDQLQDGEQFFIFYSDIEGLTTIRRFATEEITAIIYEDTETKDVPLFYVRNEKDGKMLYPDWAASPEQLDRYEIKQGEKRADQEVQTVEMAYTNCPNCGAESNYLSKLPQPICEYCFSNLTEQIPVTKIVVLHAALNEKEGRGWPQFYNTFPWSRAYKGFLEDRATVAKAVAATVDEIIHKQGSRGTDAIINAIQSTLDRMNAFDTNPPPPAGSTMVHNEAMTVNRRPLVTGAGDALMDGMTLLSQVSAGDGVPLHWRGRPDAMQNRATAREQERPWLEMMQRYQTFWKDVFEDMLQIVLMQAGIEFESVEATIIMQSPYIIDPQEASDAITAINDAYEKGTLSNVIAVESVKVIIGLLLTTYGASNVNEILEMKDEEKPEAVQPEEPTEPEVPFPDENMPIESMAMATIKAMNAGDVQAEVAAEYLASLVFRR